MSVIEWSITKKVRASLIASICAFLLVGYRVYVQHSDKLRMQNNHSLLMQCAPDFRVQAVKLLQQLDSAGYKPSILETWRNMKEQDEALQHRSSVVRFGRHNEVNAEGQPASTAMDLSPSSLFNFRERQFEIDVACFAAQDGLETGISWGLSGSRRLEVNEMLKSCKHFDGSLGWDPLHIQLLRQSVGDPDASPESSANAPSFNENASQWVPMQQLLNDGPPILGSRNSSQKIVEFVDLDCSFCADFSKTLLEVNQRRDSDSAAIIIRNFPLKMHKTAREKAELSACVYRFAPNTYWRFLNYLLTNRGSDIHESFDHLPQNDVRDRIWACFTERWEASTVDVDIALGKKFGVVGTPTTFINGRRITGDINAIALKSILEQGRIKATSNE
jgi:protein-disulfide isomerase